MAETVAELTGPNAFAGRDGTWYAIDGEPVPRVSSLLDAVASPELERYQRKQLFAAFERGATYDEAVRHSKRTLDALALRGTAIHTLIELKEGAKLGEVRGAATAIIELFAGQVEAVEQRIVRIVDGVPMYAGTLDLKAFAGDERCVADWKTGSIGARPYLRHLLQICAYAEATHYANGDGQLRLIDPEDKPTKGVIIGLGQEGDYRAHVVDLGRLSDGAAMLRSSLDALFMLWQMRQMYGTGSGFATTKEGREREW